MVKLSAHIHGKHNIPGDPVLQSLYLISRGGQCGSKGCLGCGETLVGSEWNFLTWMS